MRPHCLLVCSIEGIVSSVLWWCAVSIGGCCVLPPVELAQLHEPEVDRLGLLGVEVDARLVDDAGDGAHFRVLELGDLGRHVVLQCACVYFQVRGSRKTETGVIDVPGPGSGM